MANTLTQIGIETGNIVEAYHVSQSIDAFTGAEAYDITLSGSFTVTGSIAINGLTNNPQSNVLTFNSSTGRVGYTASNAVGGDGGITPSETGSFVITASATNNIITFTKGNGTTFPITVDTGSGGSGGITPSETGSFLVTASATNNVITFTKGNGTTFPITVDTGSGGEIPTWYTASSTLFTVPTGSKVGVIVNYVGSNEVVLEIQTANNIGDSVEIVTRDTADGRIRVTYDSGQIRAWSTGSAVGGSISQHNPGTHPSMKLIYTSASRWNVVRYMDNDIATPGSAISIFDSLVFQNT